MVVADSSERLKLWIIATWLGAAFVAVMLVMGQRFEDRVREQRQQLFRAEQRRIASEDSAALQTVVSWYHEHRDKTGNDARFMPSRENATALLVRGASGSATRIASTLHQVAPSSQSAEQPIYTDPQTGAQVRLYLLGERWHAYAPIKRTVPPPRLPTAISTVRHGLIAAIFVIWIGLMFFRPSLRPQRQVWANALLALVMIAIVATALQERQPPAGKWRLEQASILFCFIAMIVSIWFLVASYMKVRVDHPICRRCGYNLTGNQSGVCPECGAPTMMPQGDGT